MQPTYSTKTSIRAAQASDNPPARNLVQRSLHAYEINADFDGLDAAIGSFGSDQSPNVIELVAEYADSFAGCVAIQMFGFDEGKLFGFHVETELRGRGIGRAILAAAVVEAKALGIRQLMLDTWGAWNRLCGSMNR